MEKTLSQNQMELGGVPFSVSRPHPFGLVIEGPAGDENDDYLHKILLSPDYREDFFSLIEVEGLVVCKNVNTEAASYRKVRGKSSSGKLSQAEYYHHDGCSCPTKPRVVEIRLPYQEVPRQVATAVARFPDVIRAMRLALPERLKNDSGFDDLQGALPSPADWDKLQGRITRLVRREMDAESSRAFFRDVDRIAGAYDLPWEMGESRLMLNSHDDLTKTMQHRRAHQRPRQLNEQNGSLVKRWTAEEA